MVLTYSNMFWLKESLDLIHQTKINISAAQQTAMIMFNKISFYEYTIQISGVNDMYVIYSHLIKRGESFNKRF